MTSWTNELIAGLKNAGQRRESCRLAVHNEAQVELGRIAAARMFPMTHGMITFELIPESEWDIYPVGIILAQHGKE